MKKRLSVLLVGVVLFAMSCSPENTGNRKGGDTVYLLTKTKEIVEGKAIDFQEIKYSSTNPVVVSEFGIFNWAQEEAGGAVVIDSKFVFKNIVKTADKITLDAELLESNGDVEPYGSYVISLNKDGFMQKANFTSKVLYIKDTEFQMEYNAQGYLSRIAVTGDDEFIVGLTYEGDNIVKSSYSSKTGGNDNCAFSGYNTENKGGIKHPYLLDYDNMFDVFAGLNILGKPAKMLPSKGDWGDVAEEYTYEKNANGCVSKLTVKSDFDKEETIYTYEYIEVIGD